MTKGELIDHVAGKAGITKTEAGRAVDAFKEALTESVSREGRFALFGIGTFELRQRKARSGTAPDGTNWTKPAHSTVGFKPAKAFKEAL